MTWCDAHQIATLIHHSMGGGDDALRVAADAELRQQRSSGVNYGDVLVDIACTAGCVPIEVRFAAALQLEGMATRGTWDEGSSFSDKPLVTRRLIAFTSTQEEAALSESVPARQRHYQRLVDAVVRCLSNICALEFTMPPASPTGTGSGGGSAPVDCSPWVEHVLQSCSEALYDSSGNAYYAANCRSFLRQAASLGRQNASLWKYLANDAAEACLNHLKQLFHSTGSLGRYLAARGTTTASGDADDAHRRAAHAASTTEFVIGFASTLSSKPPVDPQVFQSFLFTPAFLELMCELQSYADLETLWPVQDEAVVAGGCEIKIQLLTFMIHAPKREATHKQLLTDILTTLTRVGEAYLQVGTASGGGAAAGSQSSQKRSEALTALITEMLESVQTILDAMPDAYTWVDVPCLFRAFMWFMVGDETADDASTEEDMLLALMESEDTTLAGCGSGSPRAVATSLIQLFLEHDPDMLLDFIDAWSTLAGQVGVGGATVYWSALASVLIAMAHQCDVSSQCLLDAAGPQGTTLVLGPLTARILHSESTPLLRGRLIYALGRTLHQSQNVDVCTSAFQFLMQLIELDAQRSGGAAASTACVALHAACTVLTASTSVCSALTTSLPSRIMECSLWVASSAEGLGAYCGGHAISVLLDVADATVVPTMWGSGRIRDAVVGILKHCTTAPKGTVLSNVITALVESHYSSEVVCSSEDQQGRCQTLQDVLHAVHAAATSDVSRGAVVMRCIYTTLPTMLQWSSTHRGANNGDAAGGATPTCACRPAMVTLSHTVCTHASTDGPHEDASLRALCVCVGTILACGIAQEAAVSAIASLFRECAPADVAAAAQHATHHGAQSQTLSNAALCLAIAALMGGRSSWLFSTDAMDAFLKGMAHRRARLKDFNVAGVALYPAVCCVVDPMNAMVVALVHSGATVAAPTQQAYPAAEFLGLWASTITFADRRTQLYTLMGWHRVLQAVFHPSTDPSVVEAFTSVSSATSCTFKKLKSLHEKHSKMVINQCTPLQAIIYGLSDMCYTSSRMFVKLSNFTQHTLFDAVLSPNRQPFVLEDPFSVELLQCTSSEGALKVLNYWSSAVPDMQPMIAAAANMISSAS